MRYAHPSLNRLAFGNLSAPYESSLAAFAERMSKILPGSEVDSLTPKDQFGYKASICQINGLHLAASSNTPMYLGSDPVTAPTLVIPFSGEHKSVSRDGRTAHWGPSVGAAFFPVGARGGTYTTDRTVVTIRMEEQRLRLTLAAMLGKQPNAENFSLLLDSERTLPMRWSQLNIENSFRTVFSYIDLYYCDSDKLAMIGLDDFIYRHLCLLLGGQKVFNLIEASSQRNSDLKHSEKVIYDLCDFIIANLHSRITLTDLESRSGYSARTLQYAFFKMFGCSPMNWIRQKRLDKAHQRIISGGFETVTKLAEECGFGSASQFSSAYKKHYGTSPTK